MKKKKSDNNYFPFGMKTCDRSDIDPNYEAYPEITEKNIRWLKVILNMTLFVVYFHGNLILKSRENISDLTSVSKGKNMQGVFFKWSPPKKV